MSGGESPAKKKSRYGLFLPQVLRIGLLCGIVFLVHRKHVWFRAQQAGEKGPPIELQDVTKFFSKAESLGDYHPQHGGRTILDKKGRPLGIALQTSPQADHLVGYSGPTNLLIVLDPEQRVLAVEILTSADTPEHVEDCIHHQGFWQQFAGLTWDEAAQMEDIDAVSGATLTSLAIFESVRTRLGGDPPSLLFPDPIRVKETRPFFPQAASLAPDDRYKNMWHVLDADGQRLGRVTRTAPAGNHIIGYEGPTDTLLAVDLADRTLGISIRSSLDNAREVGYVSDEEYFMTLFNNRTLADLAKMDIDEEQIEGVSGATMTSQAMAFALREAAEASLVERTPRPKRRWRIAARDWGTLSVILAACIVGFTRLRGHRWFRYSFLTLMIVYLGFINGDVLSQALFVGWAQNGVPLEVAPGLVLLTLAALLVPIATGRQVYCSHVCPFGAAQQLVKHRLPWQWKPGKKWSRLLKLIPLILLVVVLLEATQHWQINLAGIEPFDAFAFRVAGIASLSVAAVGMTASLFVPMAYCRYGCPTGQVLDYARTHRRSDRLGRRDYAAFGLFLLALL